MPMRLPGTCTVRALRFTHRSSPESVSGGVNLYALCVSLCVCVSVCGWVCVCFVCVVFLCLCLCVAVFLCLNTGLHVCEGVRACSFVPFDVGGGEVRV